MRVLQRLESDSAPVRPQAALAVGTAPDPGFIGRLVERCAIEPDFHVRETLTWALTRHAASATVPALLAEVRSERAQARSRALHTLSKIGDRQAWSAITPALLSDADDEMARSAWQAAVVLVPEGWEGESAVVLAAQLGRALDDPGFEPAELVDDFIRRTRDRIAAETELLTRLSRTGAAAPAGWEGVLRGVTLLRALGSKSAGARQRAALSMTEGVPVPVEALVEAVPPEHPRTPDRTGDRIRSPGRSFREELRRLLARPCPPVRAVTSPGGVDPAASVDHTP